MSGAERLLRQAGAVALKARRHLVYLLNGQRFTLTRGRPDPLEEVKVKMRLRRMGLL